MTTIAGYKIREDKKNPFNRWDALLEEWPLAIDRYARVTKGDVPYWYTERANSGAIAAAAWRAGMVALEEFQVTKTGIAKSITTKGKPKQWSGRCDLWVGSESRSLVIEAKQQWRDLSSHQVLNLSADTLERAAQDARNTKGKSDDPAAGLAYIPLYVKSKKVPSSESLDELITKVIDEGCKVLKKNKFDLFAWCFPESMRNYTNDETNNSLPGIFIFGKAA